MRRGGAGLIAAVLVLAGCKGTDSKPTEKRAKERDSAGLASRGKGPGGPTWLEDSMAKLPGAGTIVPKAGSWADPKNPNFDTAREGKGLLAGRVLDPYGNGAKNVFIRIEPVDGPRDKDGAALGILTNDAGYFMVKDLPAGRVYMLTAEARADGRPLVGMVQTRPPQPNVTIALRDDVGGTAFPSTTGTGAAGLPPPAELIPPMGLAPSSGVTPRPGDGGWAPGTGSTSTPIPPSLPGAGPPTAGPSPTPLPVPSLDPRPSVRPESTAGIETPWKPPAVSIPGGPSVPTLPLPPPGSPPTTTIPAPEKKSARPVRAGANFALVDSLDRPWDFAANRSGSLVLLDFVTTNCKYCTQTIPILTDLQARYASDGLQLIGVLCDEAPLRERESLAARYQRSHSLNYAVYVEPGAEPGAVRDRFLRSSDGYPTAVLLNAEGSVVWQGHPGKRAELEAAIRRQLGK